MSYIIPSSKHALADKLNRRQTAVLEGKKRLAAKLAMDASGLIDRPPMYQIDFVPAATRAGLAGWLTMPLLVVGNAYSIFADNVPAALTPQVPNNALWVFFGVHIVTLNDPITQIYFSTGNSAIRKAIFDVEPLADQMESDGYFTQEVVYDPQEIANVTVVARVATGVAARIVFDMVVIEPREINLS